MAGIVQQIRNLALEILESFANGLRYTELNKKIMERNPTFNHNTVRGARRD